ncbi:MAG: prefoldin subunit beta [Candidatus Bathyarchaeia archaeon]
MGEDDAIPPQLQEQLQRLQQLQQTLQAVVAQRQQLELESAEIDRALGELEKLPDDSTVYKSIGSILVKTSKAEVVADLQERKALCTTRVSILQRQQSRADERIRELQQSIQARLKSV